jgi:type IV secretion system protein TrbJ
MKTQFNRRSKGLVLLGTILAIGIAFPQPAAALFGFGDIVFDPSSYATLGHIWQQDISNYAKIVETVTQLERIYANGIQMYNLAHAMSQSFSGANKAQWATIAQTAVVYYTRDQYGESRIWSSAVSGNPRQVGAAWQMATLALNNGTYLASQTPGASPGLARLASIEAMDGSSTKCLATISQYRGNSLANQLGPILKLAIARADGTTATNSEIQQLNMLAAQHEQGNNELSAQGQIDACLVEQQILANKLQRDNQVQALNTFAKVTSLYASHPTLPAGFSASLAADIQ